MYYYREITGNDAPGIARYRQVYLEDICTKIWQAETVQGELLRANEKLADESQRNGNINFRAECHEMLIAYLRKHLFNEDVFGREKIIQINEDLNRISDAAEPYINDDLFDRLRERVIDWCLQHKTPVLHSKNRKLRC